MARESCRSSRRVYAQGLLIGLIGGFAFSLESAESLTLNDYLLEVQQKNPSYVAAVLASEGASRRSREGSLQIWPTLQGVAQYSFDDKNDSMTQISEQTRGLYTLSVVEQSPIGTMAKFSYQLSSNKYETIGTGRSGADYWDGKPSLEISQPLWRNFFGAETRAAVSAVNSAARTVRYMESYRARSILSQAEMAYWSLSAARLQTQITSEVLKRAKDLFQWAKQKADLQLTDRADSLQAEALLRLRELESKSSENALRTASRTFNRWRNIDSDEVAENLDPLEKASLQKPERREFRDDVLAALEQKKASEAQAVLGKNKNSPLIDIYGSYAFNGSDNQSSKAFRDSWTNDDPAYMIGLRLQVPLHFGLLRSSYTGYALEQQAAEKNFAQKLLEQESDWKELEHRLEEAKERLELSLVLEKVQKNKLDAEKTRLNRARTTMFQMIQAELDFATSQINRIRTHLEMLQVLSQMKIFGGNYVVSRSID